MVPSVIGELVKGLGSDIVNNAVNEATHIGIIVMDFYASKLVTEIIKRNDNRDFNNLPVYSIYNTYYGKHYFCASLYTDSAMDRRDVCGWTLGDPLASGYWVFLPHNEEKSQYYIFNTYYKEYLYASNLIKDNRRAVYTWVNGILTQESIWRIKGNLIYNEYYSCFLYECSLLSREHRRIVPCWAPGNPVTQDEWQMDLIGEVRVSATEDTQIVAISEKIVESKLGRKYPIRISEAAIIIILFFIIILQFEVLSFV